jgi:hypothetical protein
MAKRIPFPKSRPMTPKKKYLKKIHPCQEVSVRDKRNGRVVTIELASLFENDHRYELIIQ